MQAQPRQNDWTDVVIAMDRTMRVFADFVRPILSSIGVGGLSTSNLIFLMQIGSKEARVNDIVRRGRYIGSNASYALKALQEQGLIDRRQDPGDRRNAVIRWTAHGAAVVAAVRDACRDPKAVPREAAELLRAFESHCARLPGA